MDPNLDPGNTIELYIFFNFKGNNFKNVLYSIFVIIFLQKEHKHSKSSRLLKICH
jgi:hypothetical protein